MTWRYAGRDRPPFAVAPGPAQESVWDDPRPPRIAADTREVIVAMDGHTVAPTRRALRLLQTAGPPTFYLPRADIDAALLHAADGTSARHGHRHRHRHRYRIP